jgi:hypothetical protein
VAFFVALLALLVVSALGGAVDGLMSARGESVCGERCSGEVDSDASNIQTREFVEALVQKALELANSSTGA